MKPFDLTPELIDHLIHAMEDQNSDYLFDVQDLTLCDAATVPDPDAPELLPIPDWEPSDGFVLMESFVSGLKNPEWQSRLREALSGGRGAFKRFKATAKENRHIMAAWRRHKRRKMQQKIYEWYNDVRQAWGLNPLEPEESAEDRQALLLEDFSLEHTGLEGYRDDIRGLLQAAQREIFRKLPAPVAQALYEEPSWLSQEERTAAAPRGIVALDPGEQLAGVVWDLRRGSVCELQEILVRPVYRGIGLGALLFDEWFEASLENRIPYLLVRRGLAHPAIRSLAEAREFELTEFGYLFSTAGGTSSDRSP